MNLLTQPQKFMKSETTAGDSPKKRGRPKGATSGKTIKDVDPSMRKSANSFKQANAQWGIPLHVLKVAKAAGCGAFVDHRIHRDELLQWIEDHPESLGEASEASTIEDLKRQKLLEEVKLLKIKVAKENGSSIEKEQARQEWARALAICQEEARGLINDDDKYRIFCERIKAKLGNE